MDYVVRYATTPQDREAAFALRRAVFEVEQNVPRPLDRDVHDSNAEHVVVFDPAGRCVGTGRLVRLDTRAGQIGRMAVEAPARRHGVGAAVLEALEHIARLRGLVEIVLHCQPGAEAFYRKRGYVPEGASFQEHGLPHQRMRKLMVR